MLIPFPTGHRAQSAYRFLRAFAATGELAARVVHDLEQGGDHHRLCGALSLLPAIAVHDWPAVLAVMGYEAAPDTCGRCGRAVAPSVVTELRSTTYCRRCARRMRPLRAEGSAP